MDVLLRHVSPSYVTYFAKDPEIFGLYLAKLPVNKIAEPEMIETLVNLLSTHYPTQKELAYFAKEHLFKNLVKKQTRNIHAFGYITDNTVVNEPNPHNLIVMYIRVRIGLVMGSFQHHKIESLHNSVSTAHFVKEVHGAIHNLIEAGISSTEHRAGAAIYVKYLNFIWYTLSTEFPSGVKEMHDTRVFNEFRGLVHMAENSNSYPFTNSFMNTKLEEKISFTRIVFNLNFDNWTVNLTLIPSNWGPGHYFSGICLMPNTELVHVRPTDPIHKFISVPEKNKIANSLYWEEQSLYTYSDLVHDYYHLPFIPYQAAKQICNIAATSQPKEQTHCKWLIGLPNVTSHIFFNWLNRNNIVVLANVEYPASWIKENIITNIYSRFNSDTDMTSSNLSSLSQTNSTLITQGTNVAICIVNKEKSIHPASARFIIIHKRAQYTQNNVSSKAKGILTICTTYLDQKHCTVFCSLMHFYTTAEFVQKYQPCKQNNIGSHIGFWRSFLLDYMEFSSFRRVPINTKLKAQSVLEHIGLLNLHGSIYENPQVKLHILFPDISPLDSLACYKRFLCNWRVMQESHFHVPYSLHQLLLKTSNGLNQKKEEFFKNIGPITQECTLQALKQIILTRFTLLLTLLGAIPKEEYERFKDSKMEQLRHEPALGNKQMTEFNPEMDSDNPCFIFCWSVPNEHVINIEECFGVLEELLVHDMQEMNALKEMSTKPQDSGTWMWWTPKKPFFNIQKWLRSILERGVPLTFPAPIKQWVVDRTMLPMKQ